MILTVNSLLGALTGGDDGREVPDGANGPVVGKFHLVRDDRGEPVFKMPTSRLVDFEVVMGGVDCTMRCPLVWDETVREKLRKFEGWRVFEGALTVFIEDGAAGGEGGAAVTIDVLVRPAAERSERRSIVPGFVRELAGRFEEFTWDAVWEVGVAMREGEWFLVDGGGRIVSPRRYDWLGECSEGLILAGRDGKYGFVDTAGREMIPFIYDDAVSFSDGRALVTLDGESFYIERS